MALAIFKITRDQPTLVYGISRFEHSEWKFITKKKNVLFEKTVTSSLTTFCCAIQEVIYTEIVYLYESID